MDTAQISAADSGPSLVRWIIGFLLVGAAWGLTTPFMRRAALIELPEKPTGREFVTDPDTHVVKRKVWTLFYAVTDLLRRPAYAIPLVINLPEVYGSSC